MQRLQIGAWTCGLLGPSLTEFLLPITVSMRLALRGQCGAVPPAARRKSGSDYPRLHPMVGRPVKAPLESAIPTWTQPSPELDTLIAPPEDKPGSSARYGERACPDVAHDAHA